MRTLLRATLLWSFRPGINLVDQVVIIPLAGYAALQHLWAGVATALVGAAASRWAEVKLGYRQ